MTSGKTENLQLVVNNSYSRFFLDKTRSEDQENIKRKLNKIFEYFEIITTTTVKKKRSKTFFTNEHDLNSLVHFLLNPGKNDLSQILITKTEHFNSIDSSQRQRPRTPKKMLSSTTAINPFIVDHSSKQFLLNPTLLEEQHQKILSITLAAIAGIIIRERYLNHKWQLYRKIWKGLLGAGILAGTTFVYCKVSSGSSRIQTSASSFFGSLLFKLLAVPFYIASLAITRWKYGNYTNKIQHDLLLSDKINANTCFFSNAYLSVLPLVYPSYKHGRSAYNKVCCLIGRDNTRFADNDCEKAYKVPSEYSL